MKAPEQLHEINIIASLGSAIANGVNSLEQLEEVNHKDLSLIFYDLERKFEEIKQIADREPGAAETAPA